jgi:hypothetical protein
VRSQISKISNCTYRSRDQLWKEKYQQQNSQKLYDKDIQDFICLIAWRHFRKEYEQRFFILRFHRDWMIIFKRSSIHYNTRNKTRSSLREQCDDTRLSRKRNRTEEVRTSCRVLAFGGSSIRLSLHCSTEIEKYRQPAYCTLPARPASVTTDMSEIMKTGKNCTWREWSEGAFPLEYCCLLLLHPGR